MQAIKTTEMRSLGGLIIVIIVAFVTLMKIL